MDGRFSAIVLLVNRSPIHELLLYLYFFSINKKLVATKFIGPLLSLVGKVYETKVRHNSFCHSLLEHDYLLIHNLLSFMSTYKRLLLFKIINSVTKIDQKNCKQKKIEMVLIFLYILKESNQN